MQLLLHQKQARISQVLFKLRRYLSLINEYLQLIARAIFYFFRSIAYILNLKLFIPNFISYANNLICSVTLPTMTIAAAIGVVIAVQLGPQFVSKGVGAKLGILTLLTMSRELVPILGGFMLATQYGTALTAEIANMKITEQLDALKIFKVSPSFYMITPAMSAATLLTPLIFWLAVLTGTLSTYITVSFNENLSWTAFLSGIIDYYTLNDALLCLFKAMLFAILVVIIAATIGLNVRGGGAREVGKATTATVITCFIFVIIFDFIVTMSFLDL